MLFKVLISDLHDCIYVCLSCYSLSMFKNPAYNDQNNKSTSHKFNLHTFM